MSISIHETSKRYFCECSLKSASETWICQDQAKGSHIRLSRISGDTTHHLTIPNHDPIKLGTLRNILKDVAENTKVGIEVIIELLK